MIIVFKSHLMPITILSFTTIIYLFTAKKCFCVGFYMTQLTLQEEALVQLRVAQLCKTFSLPDTHTPQSYMMTSWAKATMWSPSSLSASIDVSTFHLFIIHCCNKGLFQSLNRPCLGYKTIFAHLIHCRPEHPLVLWYSVQPPRNLCKIPY